MTRGTVVNRVETEIDANIEGLQTKLRVAEGFIEKLQGKIASSGAAAAGSAKQYGVAAQRIASVGEAAARAGELGAQGAKQLLSSASNIAFAFGPAGAIVGAVAITTLAVVQMFTRTSEEAKKTKTLLDRLKQDAESRQRRQDPVGVAQTELATVQAELARVKASIRKEEEKSGQFAGSGSRGLILKRLQDERDGLQIRVDEAEAAIADAKKADTQSRVDATEKEVEGLATLLAAGKATNEERQRAAVIIGQTRFQLEALAKIGSDDAATIKQRAELTERLKTLTEAAAEAQKKAADASKKAADEQEKQRKAAQDLADTLAAELARISATQVDDLERAHAVRIRGLREQLDADKTLSAAQRARTAAEIEEADRGGRARIAAIRAVEEAEAALDRALAPGREASTEQAKELEDILSRLRDEQTQFTAGSAAYQQIAEKIRDVEEKRLKINKDLEKSLQEQAEETAKIISENIDKFLEGEKTRADAAERALNLEIQKAQAIQDAVIGAHQLTAALGGGADEADRMLGNILQIATQIPVAAAQLKKFNTLDAKGQSMGSISEVVGSFLPILGGVAGLLSTLGQGDPAAEERHRETLAALEAIERHTGDLVGKNVTGGQLQTAQRGVTAVLAGGRVDPETMELRGTGAILRSLGISLAELEEIASSFGITLDGSLENWLALKAAIDEIDLEAFNNTFEGQMARLEAQLRLDGITDPIEIFLRRIGVLARSSAAVAGALENIDLTTVGGRAEALAALEDRLRRALSGELSTDDFKGLSLDQFIQETLRAIEELRALTPKAAEVFRDAAANIALQTEVFGLTVTDQAKLLLTKAQEAFGDVFADLDVGDVAGVQDALEAAFERATADGAIDEAEQAIIDAFLQILGLIEAGANEAAAAAQAARDKIFDRAQRDIEVNDIEDPGKKFRAIANALGEAFPGIQSILDQFDLSSADGIAAFGDALPALIDGIESGSIVIEGLAEEDIPALIAALLGIESAGDAAENALNDLADKISRAFSEIDLDSIIFGTSDIDALEKKLAALRLRGFDLATQKGRDAALDALRELAKSDPELKDAIARLIQALQGLPDIPGETGDAVEDALGAGRGSAERTSVSSAAQALTERTGNRMADFLRTMLDVLRDIRGVLRDGIKGSLAFPPLPPPLVAPAIPAPAFATLSSIGDVTVNISPGAVLIQIEAITGDARTSGQEAGEAAYQRLFRRISQDLAREIRDKRRWGGDPTLTS